MHIKRSSLLLALIVSMALFHFVSPASAQTVTITIDASALADWGDQNLSGVVEPPTFWLVPRTLDLAPGAYYFAYTSSVPTPRVDFVIGVDGTVSYSPSLEGILLGAGTSYLTIAGATVGLDASLLDGWGDQNLSGLVKPASYWFVPRILHLLPGGYYFAYTSALPTPRVDFAVGVDGRVSYSPALQGILLGAGTADLTIAGAVVGFDASSLLDSSVDQNLSGLARPANFWDVPRTLHLLPGGHYFAYSSGLPTPRIDFVVGVNGDVSYDLALQGILLGAGTTNLKLAGAVIRVATGQPDSLTLTGFAQPIDPCSPLSLLPGGHRLALPSGNVDFVIQANGTINFAAALDGQLSGRDTSTLSFRDGDGVPFVCNHDPVASCAQAAITVECTSSAGAQVMLDGSASSDPDGDTLLYHWDVSEVDVILDNPSSATPSGVFPIGVTMATLTVVDQRGGVDTCDVVVTVQDSTPPQVMVTTNLASLWPPNHTMRSVQIKVVATDACQAPGQILPLVVRVRSNEPDDAIGNGDGGTVGDVNGSDGFAAPVTVTSFLTYNLAAQAWIGTIQLRAERDGNGNGRAYSIDVTAFDGQNNFNTTSCVVVVPHDQSNH